MAEFLRAGYYWIDLLIGLGAPLVLFALLRRGRIDRRTWRLFWFGAFLGLFWEVPVFVLSKHGPYPLITWVRDLPLHYSIFLLAHTLWDGALFVVGLWLVARLCRPPTLARFRWAELAVLVAWGQISSFAVEVSSVLNDAWVYTAGYWWNPTLLTLHGHPLTLWPQIPWLVAPVVFYVVATRRKTVVDP